MSIDVIPAQGFATSAGLSGGLPVVFLIGSLGEQPGTASCGVLPALRSARFVSVDNTSSGIDHEIGEDRSAGAFVHALRRISGLTWDQLARIFGVSRRTMHLWASGKLMTVEHETKLHRITAFVHKARRGDARRTRAALLSVGEEGFSALELLEQCRYKEAEKVAGIGTGSPQRPLPSPLSAEARQARRPRPVVDLLGTEPDVVRQGVGRFSPNISRRLRPPK
jgi:transcriptional regulator with XRE-family HTH domain